MSSTVQITGGAFQDATGSILASGYLLLSLSQDAQVDSQEIGSGQTVEVPLDSSGNVVTSPAVNIWPNDVLSPSNTFYNVSAYGENGQLVWGPSAQQVLSIPSPFDIGAWVPGAVALVPQQTGSITGLIEAGTNVSFSGSGTIASPYVVSADGSGDAITALTGDVTATGPGSAAATLASVNANPGTAGSASAVPVLTTDVKGRVTAVSTAALGTIATQDAGDVAITGGTITGTDVGLNHPATGSFTTITVGTEGTTPSWIGNSTGLTGLNVSGGTEWSLTNSTGAATFKQLAVNGSQAITGLQGTSGTSLAATTGSFTSGNLVVTDASGNVVDSGVAKPSSAFGTMATQNASSVAITGGTVDGATIGSTTPEAVSATTLDSSGTSVLGNAFRFYTGNPDGSTSYTDFRTNPASGNGIISAKTASLYFNYDHGDAGTYWCNGTSACQSYMAANGHLTLANNSALGTGATPPSIQNGLDIAAQVAVGASYANAHTAPTNGAIIQGNVGIGTSSVAASAALEVSSTTQGFLPPVMTTTQKDAISSPATGLVVYDSTLDALCVHTSTGWKTISAS